MTDPASLAIVGGGASAVFFLAHVALLPDPPSSVTVFDRTGRFGLGIAYGTEEPCHLLNTRACKTSALHADPDHFVRWVAGYGYGPDDYAPRALYATYLQDVLKAATQRLAAAGCRLSFEQAEVRGVNPVPDGYTLSFGEGGQDRGFESVLIATGNVVPIAPTGAGALSPADGYHASPWGVDWSALVRQSRRIVILGTGLSMVDTLLSLDRAGYGGGVQAISRRGLIPQVHQPPSRAPWSSPPESALPDTALGALAFVKGEVARARSTGLSWQVAVDGLRSLTNPFWKKLDEGEREKVLRRLMPFWTVHRHRMAPQAGEIVKRFRDEGRFVLTRDRVERVEGGNNTLAVQGQKGRYDADTIINCLGYSPQSPLKMHGIPAIGPAMTGELFETTALPEIREQAAGLAALFSGIRIRETG